MLWPRLSSAKVDEKLSGFLTAAAAQGLTFASTAAADTWTSLWVERRALQEVYDRLVVLPSSVDVTNRGSTSYTAAQLDALRLRIDALTVQIDALEEAVTAVVEGAFTIMQGYRDG